MTTSYSERLTERAAADPGGVAVVAIDRRGEEHRATWAELDARAWALAGRLRGAGVRSGQPVIVALPNGIDHIVGSFATWRAGGWAVPLRDETPPYEREHFVDLVRPAAILGGWEADGVPSIPVETLRALAEPAAPSAPVVAPHTAALGTGGSTGVPKLIFLEDPPIVPADGALGPLLAQFGWSPGQTQLVAGPLYHGAPFRTAIGGLLDGQRLVVLERFDPATTLDVIERHRVQCGWLVPTMLVRLLQIDGLERRDLSSIVSVATTGGACPEWAMRRWIELLGPERIWEGYSTAEGYGFTVIRGDDWLEHPGSVGRPWRSRVRVVADDGTEVPAGDTGQIFMRRDDGEGPLCPYIGAPPMPRDADGFCTAGDLGHVDEDGYLHIADRRVDMIVTGAANVYPAEVESVLLQHPEIVDAAVIGIPDGEWGREVRAVVVARRSDAPPQVEEVRAFVRERLASYKVPKAVEVVPSLPRNDMGKLHRGLLAEQRTPAPPVTASSPR